MQKDQPFIDRPVQTEMELAFPEPVRGKQAFPERVRSEQAFPERVQSEQAFPERVRTEQAFPEPVRSEQAFPDRVHPFRAEKKCVCFTGHRIISMGDTPVIERRLDAVLRKLIRAGYTEFAAGGALGFDTLAARAVLTLRREFREIKLHLVLPCRNQSQAWNDRARAEYDSILSQSDKVTFVSDEYTDHCMRDRNRRLVDISGICVCWQLHNGGGTGFTVRYAKDKGLKIINIGKEDAMKQALSELFPD